MSENKQERINKELYKLAEQKAARDYINNIKNSLIEHNRFFTEKRFLSILFDAFNESKKILPKGTVLYRSRIYKESDSLNKKHGIFEQSLFEGYDAKNTFVNLQNEWPIYGRMNPSGVRVLYTSSDIKTSVKELNPSCEEIVSVAEILCNEDLVIADLSDISFNDKKVSFDRLAIPYIQELLSQGYSEKEYVFSQYVASYCASLSFDGIGYISKYRRKSDRDKGNGINYTIFNYSKCEAISSQIHIVKNTTLELSKMNAKI